MISWDLKEPSFFTSTSNHALCTDVFCSPEIIHVPCNILGYHLGWPFRFVAVLVLGLFGLWPFRLVIVSVCGRFSLWPFRFVAFPVCGRFGLWPFRLVAISVCGRFGCGRFGLWSLWPVTLCTTLQKFGITWKNTRHARLSIPSLRYLLPILTHWGRDKMVAIFQTTFLNCIFLNENVRIALEISLKFVPRRLIKNIPALVQIMAWRRPGDKPLSEPMVVSLLTHICVTRPQWVNHQWVSFWHNYLIATWTVYLMRISRALGCYIFYKGIF